MLLGGAQAEHLARLGQGEAFFFGEGYYAPRLVHTRAALIEDNASLEGKQLRALLCQEPWFIHTAQACAVGAAERLHDCLKDLESRRMAINDKVAQLVGDVHKRLAAPVDQHRAEALATLVGRARQLKQSLREIVTELSRSPIGRLLNELRGEAASDAGAAKLLDDATQRIEKTIQPGVKECTDILDRCVQRCKPARASQRQDHGKTK